MICLIQHKHVRFLLAQNKNDFIYLFINHGNYNSYHPWDNASTHGRNYHGISTV